MCLVSVLVVWLHGSGSVPIHIVLRIHESCRRLLFRSSSSVFGWGASTFFSICSYSIFLSPHIPTSSVSWFLYPPKKFCSLTRPVPLPYPLIFHYPLVFPRHLCRLIPDLKTFLSHFLFVWWFFGVFLFLFFFGVCCCCCFCLVRCCCFLFVYLFVDVVFDLHEICESM